MPVIGTAGHVDHGKSALVEALTGIDPDRLREEKERGLTIDLGFAWLTLPSGIEVGIVDVPGHERFIKNMLAGAGGVDLALLVIAADEGPRPQTREHLSILELLEIPAGIVVLTKCDTVETDYLDLAEAEVSEAFAGSSFEGAPILRTSAVTGYGLDELRRAIDSVLATLPAKRNRGRPRLPIDRAFTIQGFGAVVTGTLLDGSLSVGDELQLFPGGKRCRVRGLQRHRTKVASLGPGTRAAVNLSGVRTEEIQRGMVLGAPETVSVASTLVARLSGSRTLSHPLPHDSEVTLCCATSETQARVRLLDCDSLSRGAEAWAQIVLEEAVPLLAGDHVILRTPDETVAGGPVILINGRRLRRTDSATLESLGRALSGTPEARILEILERAPADPASLAGALAIEVDLVESAVGRLLGDGSAVERSGFVVASGWLRGRRLQLLALMDEFLAANSLRRVVPREHLRTQMRLTAAEFDIVLGEAIQSDEAELRGGGAAPAGYEPALTAAQQAQVTAFLAAISAAPFSPPTDASPPPAVLAYLVEHDMVEATESDVVFAASAFREMVERTRFHLEANGTISLAETRDLFGTSRKYAQAFLEHLDALHITRRNGDLRTLR
jgi:selenocysteine-specific elongation factor